MKKNLLFLLLITTLSAFASQFAQDLAAINHAYFNLNKNMLISGSITYDGEKATNTKIKVSMKAIDHFFMHGANTELLVTPEYKITVNHDLKVIMLDRNYANSTDDLPIQLFDTLENFYKSIKLSRVNKTEKMYELVPHAGNSKNIRIYFNDHTMLLNKVYLKMFDPKLQKHFTIENTYSYSSLSDTDIPSARKYIIKASEKSYKLTEAYKAYSLINHLTN